MHRHWLKALNELTPFLAINLAFMPLRGIPSKISADLLYALARAGHGDKIVIADANFPADRTAASAIVRNPIRVNAATSEILADILQLLPLDQYVENPIAVMDREPVDKARNLEVLAYSSIAAAAGIEANRLQYLERSEFYDAARNAFVVVQTNDSSLYANVIIYKGVI